MTVDIKIMNEKKLKEIVTVHFQFENFESSHNIIVDFDNHHVFKETGGLF